MIEFFTIAKFENLPWKNLEFDGAKAISFIRSHASGDDGDDGDVGSQGVTAVILEKLLRSFSKPRSRNRKSNKTNSPSVGDDGDIIDNSREYDDGDGGDDDDEISDGGGEGGDDGDAIVDIFVDGIASSVELLGSKAKRKRNSLSNNNSPNLLSPNRHIYSCSIPFSYSFNNRKKSIFNINAKFWENICY
jgi:hypothetical protein